MPIKPTVLVPCIAGEHIRILLQNDDVFGTAGKVTLKVNDSDTKFRLFRTDATDPHTPPVLSSQVTLLSGSSERYSLVPTPATNPGEEVIVLFDGVASDGAIALKNKPAGG